MIKYLFISLFFSLLLLSCDYDTQPRKDGPVAEELSAESQAENKVQDVNAAALKDSNNLILRLHTGDRFEVKYVFDQIDTMLLEDNKGFVMDVNTLRKRSVIIEEYTVKSIAENGDITLIAKMTQSTERFKQNDDEETIYDSRKYSSIDQVPYDRKFSYALLGKEYEIVITPLGEMVGLNKMDELKSKILGVLNPSDNNYKQTIINYFDKIFDFTEMKEFFKMVYNYTTLEDITKTNKWKKIFVSFIGKKLVVHNNFEIKSKKNNMLNIVSEGTFVDNMPDYKISHKNNVTGVLNGSGEIKGRLLVDRKTGLFSKIHYLQKIKLVEKQYKKNAPENYIYKNDDKIFNFSATASWK